MIDEKQSFEDIYFELAGTDSISEREVEWQIPEQEVIHNALYSNALRVNQVIGPLLTEDGFYIVMKVKGWTDRVVITEKDINQRVSDVQERLTQKEAVKIFQRYAGKIMKGKRIVFSKEAFENLVSVFAPIYLSSEQEKKDLFLYSVFNKETGDSLTKFEELGKILAENRDNPFYKIDGEVWTVQDFEKALEIHPLVFRKRNIKNSEFAEQFKLAIVDMVRDKYVTKDAYKKGYDKVNVVERNVNMWQDAIIAQYQKYQYLEDINIGEKSSLKVVEEHLNPYIDELQEKYSDVIAVDVDHFNDIELTRIDMFATQRNVPFPIVVPSFPQVTTDPWLDYGKKMDK